MSVHIAYFLYIPYHKTAHFSTCWAFFSDFASILVFRIYFLPWYITFLKKAVSFRFYEGRMEVGFRLLVFGD